MSIKSIKERRIALHIIKSRDNLNEPSFKTITIFKQYYILVVYTEEI